MNKNQIQIFYLYIIFCFIFIITTTEYLSLEDIIYTAGQTDAISYSEIAKYAPQLPYKNEVIIQHVAQRFLIPYLIGNISRIFEIDFFIIFKIFTIFFIFFYSLIITFICKNLKFNLKLSILFFSILFLNPYIVRNHLFQPVQAHDMLFFCFGLIFGYTILKRKFTLNIFIILFSVFLRQTSIAMFIASVFLLIKEKKYKYFIILFFLCLISLTLTIKLGNYISINKFPIHLTYGILFYDFSQYIKLIKFFLLTAVAFFPLLIVFFGKLNLKFKNYTSISLFACCVLMIGQPLAAGPDGSLGNVVRIANLCFPILVLLIFYVIDFKKFIQNKILYYTYILGLFFWSMHPTFSNIKIFSILRFYPH